MRALSSNEIELVRGRYEWRNCGGHCIECWRRRAGCERSLRGLHAISMGHRLNQVYQKTVVSSGSAVIVFAFLYFFLPPNATSELTFGMKSIAALVCISGSLIGLRLYFRWK